MILLTVYVAKMNCHTWARVISKFQKGPKPNCMTTLDYVDRVVIKVDLRPFCDVSELKLHSIKQWARPSPPKFAGRNGPARFVKPDSYNPGIKDTHFFDSPHS